MSSCSTLITTLMILSLTLKPTSSISISISISIHSPPKPGDLLLADAHFAADESATATAAAVQLSRPTPSSFGIIIPNTPFNFTSSTSLSSNFTFQIGSCFSLVIIPSNFVTVTNMSFEVLEAIDAYRLLGIEFFDNVCKVSGSRVGNVSKSDSVLKGGVRLTSWIDYHAALKRLEVRVASLGDAKPVEPMVSVRVDLGEVLKNEEVMFGLAGFNEKDERVTFVYSWSLEIKDAPKWMHSIPVNPEERSSVERGKERSGFGSGFMFATGCGVLAAFVMSFVWSYVVDRRMVRGEGEGSGSAGDFKYEKIDVVEVKNSETSMK